MTLPRLDSHHASAAAQLPDAQETPKIKPNPLIDEVRRRVFLTISERVSIATFFKPELKINFEQFTKDQILINRLAIFLKECIANGCCNQDSIAKALSGNDLLAELKELFKHDPSPYLNYFFEACVDVAEKKFQSVNMTELIENRIYTLKNALIAIHTPTEIQKAQGTGKRRNLSAIQEDGKTFIRASLQLHIDCLEKKVEKTFQETLTSTAEQLVPFIKQITKSFLYEYGKVCSENPLTFRNPTGYNHHGLVAASIMEVCLNALGYQTRLLGRSDLEPKVTLATAHNVVEVTGPQNEKYLVDPCYIQFHKDVSIDESSLPQLPVLVLKKEEIDQYIEEKIMRGWKVLNQKVIDKDQETIKRLNAGDKILTFTFRELIDSKEVKPENMDVWVRNAFHRVWNLSTYQPILSDQGMREIFFGEGERSSTFQSIQHMKIASLTHSRSIQEVESQLNKLLQNHQLKNKNDSEPLKLIAMLPKKNRTKYDFFLDTDPRINPRTGLNLLLNTYYRSLRPIVNPKGNDIKVLYGCAGADCITPLLATDALEYTFVDMTPLTLKEFKDALELLKSEDLFSKINVQKCLNSDYLMTRSNYGGGTSIMDIDGNHKMQNLALKLLFDLIQIGVDLQDISLSHSKNEDIIIEFPWCYYGEEKVRKRKITYLKADISNPSLYPDSLKKQLDTGFNVFYMKAAFNVPRLYPQFLPAIAVAIPQNGWLMTSDKTFLMEQTSADECSDVKKDFVQIAPEIKLSIEDLLHQPFDPLNQIFSLENIPPERRYNRVPGSDITYWSILNLRQKQ